MFYLRNAINKLEDTQRDLTNAQTMSDEIKHYDRQDIDDELDVIINRLKRYERGNISKNFSEDLSDSLKENLK